MSRLNSARKASRTQLKARVALDGPTGAGKTFTALEWAIALQGEGGTTLMIDTEGGSGEWYSDKWTYDALRWEPPYGPGELADTLKDAQSEYDVTIIDSLSHFWEGEGGTLEIVDAAAAKSKGNTYAGWKVGTPALRHLIDTIQHCDMHVIVTMRSKMDYVLTQGKDGKQRPEKVGMAPVMRAGIEYEFTLIGDLDLDHQLAITKSRCSALADKVFQPGRAGDAAGLFLDWLNDGEPLADRSAVEALIDSFNAIPEGEARNKAKKEFVEAFGRPERLSVSGLETASGWADEKITAAINAAVQAAPSGNGALS